MEPVVQAVRIVLGKKFSRDDICFLAIKYGLNGWYNILFQKLLFPTDYQFVFFSLLSFALSFFY